MDDKVNKFHFWDEEGFKFFLWPLILISCIVKRRRELRVFIKKVLIVKGSWGLKTSDPYDLRVLLNL